MTASHGVNPQIIAPGSCLLTLHQIASMIDISAVRTDVTLGEITMIAEVARKHRFICAFAMPCFTSFLIEALHGVKGVGVGGVVGFPSGADTTQIKVATARELIAMGVGEIDMVINVGALKSGNYNLVGHDIKSVVDAAGGIPVKTILEVAYLSDDEIRRGSIIAAQSGASYIKTGTGWAAKPASVETIKLISATVGDRVPIKAAGGIRNLSTLLEMYKAGCSRFGIGLMPAQKIMEEAALAIEMTSETRVVL